MNNQLVRFAEQNYIIYGRRDSYRLKEIAWIQKINLEKYI